MTGLPDAVIGFDDIPQARWVTPGLSSVVQDFDTLGRSALTLSDELQQGAAARSLMLSPALVVRGSTVPAAQDSH